MLLLYVVFLLLFFRNIIDVSAIEPHSIERSEYMEQMKNYLYQYFYLKFIF